MSGVQLYGKALAEIKDTVRAAASLAAQDLSFYTSIETSLDEKLQSSKHVLLQVLSELTGDEEVAIRSVNDSRSTGAVWNALFNHLGNVHEESDKLIDSLSQRANSTFLQSLDELDGTQEFPEVTNKPQINFEIPIDNSDSHPFQPKLNEKPHAIEPLNIVADPQTRQEHPYLHEIQHCHYPESVFVKSEEKQPKSWKNSTAIWVDNTSLLDAMLGVLSSVTEIAVDLEHHDFRSYYGLTCLLQISTRDADFIVDTLALRDKLSILNEVFANPKVLKVFHGSRMDIIWLQRDLGIYVVSLFDTYFASKALGFPKFSLAYLLETFAKFRTSKKYQLADWRVRPLPSILFDYARSDTHFLLSIYDTLRNRLIDTGKLDDVLNQSRLVASRKFEYVKFRDSASNTHQFGDEMNLRSFVSRYNIPSQRFDLIGKIFEWRDDLARIHDESPRFVISNTTMASLCHLNYPFLENDVAKCFGKMSYVVEPRLKELHKIMNDFHKLQTSTNILEISQTTTNPDHEMNNNDVISRIMQNSNSLVGSPCASELKKESQFFNFQLRDTPAIAISAANLTPTFVSHNEIAGRAVALEPIRSAISHLISVAAVSIVQKENAEVSNDPTEIGDDVHEESAKNCDKSSEPDLVVLKAKRSHSERRVQKDTLPIIDYEATGISILGGEQNKNLRKYSPRDKKRKDQSVGPAPYKRKKVAQKGKSISFKNA